MLIDTGRMAFDMRQVQNRRFMYQPQTGTLILGYQYKGGGVVSSHADEHDKSGATEPYDSFIRGWIGTGRQYPNGVIHFAPAIPPDNAAAFDKAFSVLQMFSENGANENTVVRGFGSVWEQPISNFITPNEERSDKKPMPYTSYDLDKLEAADTMRIERHIYFDAKDGDVAPYATLPLTQLLSMRNESAAAEQAVFDSLKEQAAAWEEQAGKTLLLDKAIEYARTPHVQHTANEWQTTEHNRHTRSNRVYQMSYYIYENTRYDREKQQSIPYSWTLTWSVRTNSPSRTQAKIAGQDRKTFADKAAMEKYLNGRIKAYDRLFTEISPTIPKEYADYFKVNGLLMPDYAIEGEEPPQPERGEQDKTFMDAAETPQDTTVADGQQPRPVVPIIFTSEKPADKVKEITARLEQGVQAIFDSDRYKEFLTAMSKFHDYSLNNTILIAMQGGNLVKGYTQWQKDFDRHVKSGEKGIKIFAPAPYKVKKLVDKIDPETRKPMLDREGKAIKEEKEITVPAFKVVTVFDISQTEGKEFPDLSVKPLLADVEQYEDFFAALEKASPVPIAFEQIGSGANGYFSLTDKRIAIKEGVSELQAVKTAIHEIAHAKLHDVDLNAPPEQQNRIDRHTREVQAESVAYTVCQHFGLDTSDYSFGYVAGWSSGKEMTELKASLETIQATAKELITEIEGHFTQLQQQREAEQEQQTPVFDKLSPEQQQALSDTVKDTLQMLVDADKRIYGDVTGKTLEAIAAQGYSYKDGQLEKQQPEMTPDGLMTGETVQTPRGNFYITDMSREQIEAAGYGFHHASEDGKYLIMGNGTRAFAIAAQQPERDNPLKAAEQTVEQNENMIDGIINNTPQTPTVADLEQRAKAGEAISVTDMAKAVQAEKGKQQPQKKTSILKKLDEYKKQAAQQPKKQQQKEKNKDLEV